MSVPVRYSAAADEYAAEVDCELELESSLQEQQQLQLQQQYAEQYEQYQHYQYQREQDIAYYCHLQAARQQEQLMQQRTSMSSSVMPGLDLPAHQDHQENIATNNNGHGLLLHRTMDANSINAILVDDEQPSTSAQAAAAAAAALTAGVSGVGVATPTTGGPNGGKLLANGINHNAEMPTDWMRIADEGRYGTPGAAGLEYQKYEQQQQQLVDLEGEAAGAVGGAANNNEPSPSKKLEDQLHALTSDELYETLKEYDALQDKFHTVLLLPKESRVSLLSESC